MSLSLYTVIAEQSRKQKPTAVGAAAGADASAIHGRSGRSGCTPAEPYPPSRISNVSRKQNK